MQITRPVDRIRYVLAMFVAAAVPVVILWIQLPPPTIALSRAALAAAAMILLAVLTMQNILRIHWRDFPVLIFAGAAIGGSWYCHVLAVKTAGVLAAQVALSTSGLWMLLIGPVFQRDMPRRPSYFVCYFLALIGLVLILPNFDIPHWENLGVAYGVAAGLLLTIGGQWTLRVLQLYPMERMGHAIMTVQYLAATAVLAITLIWTPLPAAVFTPAVGGQLILLGLVLTALSRTLAGGGNRSVTPRTMVFVQACEPFVAAALAAGFGFGLPSIRVVCGALLVAISVLSALHIHYLGSLNLFKPVRWN